MPDDNRTNGLQLDMMTHNTLLLQNIQESSSENNTYMKFLSFFLDLQVKYFTVSFPNYF